jgi:acetylornithine deacetylase/succinyl-diaminopimelate desuccinylase-like protein
LLVEIGTLLVTLTRNGPLSWNSMLADKLEYSSGDLEDTIRLFQGLIRIDTTNPPGNEGKAAEFLKEQFEKNDVECEVLGEPGRENIIAKVRGSREKPRLLLLSHTDVVPAVNVGEWTHPPFAAEIERNWIYGRGAWDDKFDATVQAISLILLKRRNVRLDGTLLYASVADEEVLGTGAEWLTKKVPEKVAAEYVVGEGGGAPVQLGSRKFYPISVGEKGLAWLRLRATGEAGHGSVPTLADNANVVMARAFNRLADFKTEISIVPEVDQLISMVSREFHVEAPRKPDGGLDELELDCLLDKIAPDNREVAEELRALSRMTISPNVIKGGTETNVIPGICEGRVDIRLVPGQDGAYATRIVKECLKGLKVEVDIDQYTEASLSPSNTGFYNIVRLIIEEMMPGCVAYPVLGTGMSDSRYWRAVGSVVYGLVPTSPDTKLADIRPGVHGANERMNIESLEFATKFLCNMSTRVLQ